MRVLLTLRDIEQREQPGGIGHYYKALRPYLPNCSYFTVGRRNTSRHLRNDALRLFTDYRRFWRDLRPDVDLVNLNPSLGWCGLFRDGGFLLLAKLRRKKVVVFFRGWDEATAATIDRVGRRLFLLVFGRADGLIVLSGRFKEKLFGWGYRGPIWVESTTVNDRLLTSPGGKRSSEKVNVLFLARVERKKGIYEALAAYATIMKKYPHVEMTVVGSGGESCAIQKFIEDRNLPGVTLRGYLDGDKKRDAFCEADIYLFPSYSEGMPNSVLEAMAFGLPVVTTAVGGLTEFFEDGKMGYILERGDPESLAECLKRLIEDPQHRLAVGAFNAAYARKHFLASKVAQRLQQVWEIVGGDGLEGENAMTWRPPTSGPVVGEGSIAKRL